jgi:methylglutaconyl-CoA hydratase
VETLRVEREGPVLRVTLARAERRNAFDETLIAELTDAFADVGDARAVVLTAEGPSFCAGADVEWMRASVDLGADENHAGARRLGSMFAAGDGCPAPVGVSVQGHALGGGAGLVACADVVLAAPDAVFGFTEVKLGLVPAVISPFVLAKIGPSAARRYFVTGERFGAGEALRVGLVHEVADDLDATLDRTIDELLAAGPEAARAAKELARTPLSPGETAAAIAERRASDEGQEGRRAFLERRSPAWRRS